jgi:nitrogen fixation protein NifU and related proteins
MYNDQILDHLCNPRNVGSMADPDGVGHSGNSSDGDKVAIYIKVKDEILIDVRFQTYGCGAAIAASSMVTVLAKNKSISEALQITNELVAEELGGMPEQKIKCSNIAADALHDAINNYLNNKC